MGHFHWHLKETRCFLNILSGNVHTPVEIYEQMPPIQDLSLGQAYPMVSKCNRIFSVQVNSSGWAVRNKTIPHTTSIYVPSSQSKISA